MSANRTESGVGNDGRSWYSQETPSRLISPGNSVHVLGWGGSGGR